MGNYQVTKNKKLNPRFRAWLAIVILFVISLILGSATWNIYHKNLLAKENKLATVRELEDLELRKKNIKTKLDKLKTVEGREEEIRKNLPMAKEGEKVIIIVDEKDKNNSSSNQATSTGRTGLWQKMFGDN